MRPAPGAGITHGSSRSRVLRCRRRGSPRRVTRLVWCGWRGGGASRRRVRSDLGATQARFHIGPLRQPAHRRELLLAGRIGRDAAIGQAQQHDQRIVRAPAQALRAREQVHQGCILLRPLLDGTPGEIVKGFVLTLCRRFEGELVAFTPVTTVRAALLGGDVWPFSIVSRRTNTSDMWRNIVPVAAHARTVR